MSKLAFIGGGSMAEAIISGIISRGVILPPDICVMNKSDKERLNFLRNRYDIQTTEKVEELMKDAEIIILAVKPKDVYTALSTVKKHYKKDTLLISVAAGVSIDSLEQILGNEIAIIRTMPNTSAAVGRSATAMSKNKYVTPEQSLLASKLLETVGIVTTVTEEQLDAVTGLSGSGPAYIYYLVEAMEQSAMETGLEKETAKRLIVQTLLGAAEMLSLSDKDPFILRKEVTSPGGTTEAGINILTSHGVQQAFIHCIKEATKQSRRLGEQLSLEIQSKSMPL
ncbi:pyrroline-5-carboxylate reductase [Peribacillus alkalitolerans]|uniref:pyrroline-5-carboxylate reductase n=1 Tax=Peribacillus alkalitolerans TaxID=1550385 RepID=UPI0013D7BDE5|nr:pyrroline-5-carboxylate reductase [Peribacillus alkalitolerans]